MSPGTLTLDDAAALLVATEADDADGLRRLHRVLEAVARSGALADFSRSFVEGAAEKVSEILEGRAEDSAETYAAVGRLVEAAATAPAGAAEAPAAADAGDSLPADLDRTTAGDFVAEGREVLHAAEGALLHLETCPDDAEGVHTVFRAFHTLKGMSAFLGLRRLSDLAHETESLLDRIRRGEARYGQETADLALRSVDLAKELVQGVQDALGGAPLSVPSALEAHAAALRRAAAGAAAGAGRGGAASAPEVSDARLGDLLVAAGAAQPDDIEAVAASKGEAPLGEALLRAGAAEASDVGRALREQARGRGAEAAEASVRVRTDRLDRLVNFVGELVIAQSMLDQDPTVLDSSQAALTAKVGHASKVVRELQTLCMSMRMVPLRDTFLRMSRLVRDLSRRTGKVARLETSGEETEIDRTVVEAVNECLVHMVRNSIDHGLESPEERLAAGKEADGAIRIAARHQGGSVVFEVEDDGRGLDRARILAKAERLGLAAPGAALSDREVFGLIFAPGFSTAEAVTDVSGRGVGMDVVKRGVETLRGSIEVATEPGRSCRFTMRIPLTMAITEGMVVRVADHRYILPTLSIQMSLRPAAEQVTTLSGRGEMLTYVDHCIPIRRLHRLFGIEGAVERPEEGILVVLEEPGGLYALLVDGIDGQVQVVAKALGDGIGRVPGVSAGAILGDGRVGLILDTSAIGAAA